VIRLRKFIGRGWTVNAGQILKMLLQVSELDLTNPIVLEDQLTGVDAAYFCELIAKVKEKDPEKINSAYLIEIIDRMF
jgi:5,10-methenyltetrahydromethanopterin hydrogenase